VRRGKTSGEVRGEEEREQGRGNGGKITPWYRLGCIMHRRRS